MNKTEPCEVRLQAGAPARKRLKPPARAGWGLFACRGRAMTELESCLTLSEAARKYGISADALTRLVKER